MPATVENLQTALDAVFDQLNAEAESQLLNRDIPFIGALGGVADVADVALASIEEARQEVQAALAAIGPVEDDELEAALIQTLNATDIVDMTMAGEGGPLLISLSDTQETVLDTFDLAVDLGLPTFGIDVDANLELTGALTIDADFEFDLDTGALTLTDDEADELSLTLTGDIEFDEDGVIGLGFLTLIVEDEIPLDDEGEEVLNGISIELGLDFGSDIAGDAIAGVDGNAALNVNVRTDSISDFLPTFSTNLVIDYGFDAGLGEEAAIGTLEEIAFNDISVEIEILSRLLGGVFGRLADITDTFPLGPIIAVFRADLPLLTPLAEFLPSLNVDEIGGVTLVDLLTLFDKEGDFRFIQTIIQLLNTLDLLDNLNDEGGFELASIALSDEAIAALVAGDTGELIENAFDFAGADGGTVDIPAIDAVAGLTAALDSLAEAGLSIPLLDNGGSEAIGEILLSGFLGRPVSLVEFELPEFGLDRDNASFEFSIPIGPFAFVLEGGFGAAFNICVGYSTNGFLNAIESGEFDLVSFAEGFYLAPPDAPADAEPEDMNDGFGPVAKFTADLSAGFGISVPGLRITIDGGFTGQVNAFIADSTDGTPDDGLSHIGALELPCIFNPITASIGAGVKLTFQVGVSIFSWKFVLSIAEVTIANFELGCGGPHGTDTPELVDIGLATAGPEGGVPDGILRLNVGDDAENRTLFDAQGNPVNTDTADQTDNETFAVKRMTQKLDQNDQPTEQNPAFDPDALIVEAFGVRERFVDPNAIIADGGDGIDVITIEAGIEIAATLSGGIGDDVLIGGDVNDELDGGEDNDIIDGGGGDDVLRAGLGADSIDSGEGDDQVDYSASQDAVFLTRVGATVFGTGGLAEGDTLTNVEYLIGSQSGDLLTGDESDNNTLDGQDGDDTLIGGGGQDFIIGGAGADIINGKGDEDLASYVTSFGGVTVDLETGLAYGADAEGDVLSRIDGLHGSQHEDQLFGGDRSNLLDGFAGDDVLEGRVSEDTIAAGGGSDTVFARGDGDELDGGGLANNRSDRDLLSYRNAANGVTAHLSFSNTSEAENDDFIQGARLSGDSPETSFRYSSLEDLEGSSEIDDLRGDFGDNRIDGNGGGDFIDGAEGNDTIAGDEGADSLNGGEGRDWVDYSGSDAGVTVSLDPDAINSGGHAVGDTLTGFENILGSRFNDSLTGSDPNLPDQEGFSGAFPETDGKNIIDPGLGQDTVDGGAGDDILRIDFSGLDVNAGFAGGFTLQADLVDPNVQTGGFVFAPEAGSNAPGVTFQNIERLDIKGTLRTDIIFGSVNNDTIRGGGGNDVISGNDGADFLLAGEGDDLVFAQLGENLLTISDGGAEFFNVDGSAGYDGLSIDLSNAPNAVSLVMRDSLEERTDQLAAFTHGGVIQNFEFIGTIGGTAFSDTLVQEGDLNNIWFAAGGDDFLAPGLGSDVVDGGEPPLDPADETDSDFLFLDYSVDETGTSVTASFNTNAIIFERAPMPGVEGDPGDRLFVGNIEFGNIIATAEDDVILGFEDALYDGPGDTLEGRDGDDTLTSFDNNDLLLGGAGEDVLDAGIDDDTLQGGLADRDDGNDISTGGAGRDLFIAGDSTGLHYGEQVDGAAASDFLTITDFETGVDQIQLTGRADDFSLTTTAGATLVTQGFGRTDQTIVAIVEDGGPSGLSLSSSDFTFVREVIDGGFEIASAVQAEPLTNVGIVSALLARDDLRTNLTAGENTRTIADRKTALTDVTPETIKPLGPTIIASEPPDDGGIALPNDAFTVTQGSIAGMILAKIAESLSNLNIAIDPGGDSSREGDARAFGTFENGFGFEDGAVISNGIAENLPGLNEEDGGLISNQFGGSTVDLDFQVLGTALAGTNQETTYYIADLSDIPFDIASLVLKDDNDGVGGSGGSLTGADIDGLMLTSVDPTGAASIDAALDLAAANQLDLFAFDAVNTVFTLGVQRSISVETPSGGVTIPDIGTIGGGDGDDTPAPSATPSSENLAGSVGGYVDNEQATLDVFDYNGLSDGFLSLAMVGRSALI